MLSDYSSWTLRINLSLKHLEIGILELKMRKRTQSLISKMKRMWNSTLEQSLQNMRIHPHIQLFQSRYLLSIHMLKIYNLHTNDKDQDTSTESITEDL